MDFHDRRTGQVSDVTAHLGEHMQQMHGDALDFGVQDGGMDPKNAGQMASLHDRDHAHPLMGPHSHSAGQMPTYNPDSDSMDGGWAGRILRGM